MASLSDLPDELLLSVISLLPADDAVVFGWIDRRCRYLAVSVNTGIQMWRPANI
jgi:hypothetical protein